MAQPSFDSILNAVMQAESGGRRYDERGNLLTSPKGAKGEMQVLDTTKFRPGFGVEPARANTPDERARVGRDYLKAMLERYGDVDKALAAYNWGPGNTDKWIAKGADPSKLPAETRGYIDQIKSALSGSRPTAQAPAQVPEAAPVPAAAAGAPRAAPVKVSEVEPAARTADLGAGYQAALALSYLADEDERGSGGREYDERQPSISSQWLARETARVKPEMLTLPYRSPFEEEKPVAMADGGFIAVGYGEVPGYEKGGAVKRLPAPSLVNAKLWAETVARDMYPSEDDNVKRDAARHMLAAAIVANKTSPGIAEGLGKAYEFKESPVRTMGHWLGLSQPRADYPTDTRNNALGAAMAELAKDPKELQRAVRTSIEKGEAALTPDEVRAMGYKEGGEVSDEPTPEELERASKPAFGIVPSSGKGRKQGRVSEALQSGEAQREFLKGMTMVPQNLVGAPVDIATMAMRPFGYSVEKPVGGSEYLKEKSRAAGVAFKEPEDPTLRAFFTAGDISSNLVNPAGATRTAVRGVEKTGEAAKMLADMATRPVERDPFFAGPAGRQRGAVKPRGGTVATSGSIYQEPVSKLDNLLDRYVTEIDRRASEDLDVGAVKEFVDKKVRKYFTDLYGTAQDPIRLAIKNRELRLMGEDVERIPDYLIEAANTPGARGHEQAKRHLEKFYDMQLGIEAKRYGETPSSQIRRAQEQAIQERMSMEGVPLEYQNLPYISNVTASDVTNYPNSNEMLRKMLEAKQAGTLPSGQAFALEKGLPFYDVAKPSLDVLDPVTVAENISALPPEKLKNLSFDRAMVEGSRLMQPRRDYSVAVDMAARGARVPKDVLSTFTKPVTDVGNQEWVRLTDTIATQMEGKLMHHSVGGYHTSETYGHGGIQGFKNGRAQIFSLRDKKNGMPEVTLEAEKTDKGLEVSQIKGDFNSFPGHRANEIFTFIDKNPEVRQVSGQIYTRNDRGEDLEKQIIVDWQKSFDNWKALGGDGTGQWIPREDTPSTITYIWGAPTGKAAGGIVERRI